MKKLKYSVILMVTFILFAAILYNQTMLSLGDAIKKGLENNFGIRISRENLKIAANNNTWGAAGRYPTLDIGLNFNNSYKEEPSRLINGERDKYTQNTLVPYVNLRWVLFNGFAIKIAKNQLAELNKISGGNAAIAVENTLQAIVLAYYKVLLEKKKLSIVEKVKKLSLDRYDYVKAKKEFGAAGTYDVLQAKIAWLDDTSTLLLQQVNKKNALRNLNLIMGESVEQEYELTDGFKAEMKDYLLEDLLNKLFENNKTLKNQYINQAILKKEIALQKSALFPTISLNSGINRIGSRIKYKDSSAVNSLSYDYYINFSVGLNLFNGGNTRRSISNAKIQEKIGVLQTEELKLTLKNILLSTFGLYNAEKQLYEVAIERIKSAQLNLEISEEKFKSGTINSFNYRDVQLIYLNSAFGKLQAIYDLIETHTELMRLTGGVISEY